MNRIFTSGLLLVAMSNLIIAQTPVDIGKRRELFVDRFLIEEMDGVDLMLHRPVKAERPTSPLPPKHYITVIKDGDLFRAYWRARDPSSDNSAESGDSAETVNYAESRDGHEWTFPSLGIHEIAGSRANNVILAKMPALLHNFSPFLDSRPGVLQDERFKALSGHPGPGDKRGKASPGMGLTAFHSADGIQWTRQQEVIPYRSEWRHAFDSQNVSFWSATENQYVCYFRTWTPDARLRSISRTTSVDFKVWSEPVAMNPNFPGEHLYTNQTHPYFRAPHIYIALPTRYVPGRGDVDASADHRNATDILLMTTRAGSERFDRTFTEAFIRPGLDPERWRNRANYVALNVVPTGAREMSIYHRSGDRYVLRTDGFASVHAGGQPGEFLTRPIVFGGRSLSVNLSTSAAGGIRVEIQTASGAPIPGFGLEDCDVTYGDDLDLQVSWNHNTNLAALVGQPVRLRFVMTDCDLFAFQFRDQIVTPVK